MMFEAVSCEADEIFIRPFPRQEMLGVLQGCYLTPTSEDWLMLIDKLQVGLITVLHA